ncbi:hypothetical protein CcCBS67573_g04108 [Chytriomyces confervae]|uniref:Uncharacterized protein n=1 Tax=Chytriomyces confervae TaxID=246404 RepID=A0A507FE58_9FUNG|nr:hypothetical protein CcCBS67573_g04108 [Chytriomyces confervae]
MDGDTGRVTAVLQARFYGYQIQFISFSGVQAWLMINPELSTFKTAVKLGSAIHNEKARDFIEVLGDISRFSMFANFSKAMTQQTDLERYEPVCQVQLNQTTLRFNGCWNANLETFVEQQFDQRKIEMNKVAPQFLVHAFTFNTQLKTAKKNLTDLVQQFNSLDSGNGVSWMYEESFTKGMSVFEQANSDLVGGLSQANTMHILTICVAKKKLQELGKLTTVCEFKLNRFDFRFDGPSFEFLPTENFKQEVRRAELDRAAQLFNIKPNPLYQGAKWVAEKTDAAHCAITQLVDSWNEKDPVHGVFWKYEERGMRPSVYVCLMLGRNGGVVGQGSAEPESSLPVYSDAA